MTLKQFLYLVSGVGTAYLCFVFLASPFPFLAWPIIAVSSLLGVAFAFLPISDRPLDHWIVAFLKAIYSPTKRVWQKNSQNYQQTALFNLRYHTYLSALTQPVSAPPPPLPFPTQLQTPLPPPPMTIPFSQPQPPEDLPSSEELSQTVTLAREAQSLQVEIIESERELSQIKASQNVPKFNEAFDKLQKLAQKASQVKQQLSQLTDMSPKPVPAAVTIVKPSPVRPTQITLTTFPNVINGIITDQNGNYLNEVVVVIYDKDGLPVRALKSNKLGQFTGSTPLPNAVYTIELEKESFIFDMLQMELKGAVLAPLQIRAKKEAAL